MYTGESPPRMDPLWKSVAAFMTSLALLGSGRTGSDLGAGDDALSRWIGGHCFGVLALSSTPKLLGRVPAIMSRSLYPRCSG